MGPITLDYRIVPKVPSDDEMVPAEKHTFLPRSPSFDLMNSKSAPLWGDGGDGYMTNVRAPKRPGVDLDAPFPQGARITLRTPRIWR